MFNKTHNPSVGKSPIGPSMDSIFAGGVPPVIHPQTFSATPMPIPGPSSPMHDGAEVAYVAGASQGGDMPNAIPEPSGVPFVSGESLAVPVVATDIGRGQGWQQGDVRDDTLSGPRLNNSATGTDPATPNINNVLGAVGRE